MPTEYLTVTGRVAETGCDGQTTLVLEEQRCANCVCFWRSTPRRTQLVAPSRFPLGASVDVRLPMAAAAVFALALYGLPWGGMLLGAGLAAILAGGSDLPAVIGAVAGLVLGVIAMRLLRDRCERMLGERLRMSRH